MVMTDPTPLGSNRRNVHWRAQGDFLRHWMATKAIVAVAFAVLSCWGLAQTRSAQDKPEPVRLTKGGRKWVEATLRGLSLEEKVGQMLQVRSYGEYPNFETADYKWLQERFRRTTWAR